jgi:hypothetical protein
MKIGLSLDRPLCHFLEQRDNLFLERTPGIYVIAGRQILSIPSNSHKYVTSSSVAYDIEARVDQEYAVYLWVGFC